MEGRLGDTLFPAPGSQQRASSDKTARHKVALRPGHSLMDWIRLTNSGKDLSGVGGKLLDVTPEELAKHCHPHDAWIALKGKVYNVTAYMDFHPGGSEELSRGIGKEATSLFNEVHKWVNFESMLSKCLVGRLKTPSVFLLKEFKLPIEKVVPKKFLKPKLKEPVQVLGQPSPTESEPKNNRPTVPKYDWYQSEETVCIVIYNKWIEIRPEHIVLDVDQRILRVSVHIQEHSFLVHLELNGDVECNSKVKIGANTGNVEIVLEKRSSSRTKWPQLGTPLDDHNTLLPNKEREVHYRWCILQSKSRVSSDTYLFTFSLPEGTHMVVPIGHHIHLKMTVDHVEVSRSYTPVSLSLRESSLTANGTAASGPSYIHLMIKVYDQGTLTPLLHKLSPKDKLCISGPMGTFDASRLETCKELVLLAAGTGFTPMVKLISSCLFNSQNNRFVKLLFFNKTEDDILWKDQLESLSSENERFQVHHILSSPSSSWSGARGRIRRHLLETLLPPPSKYSSDASESENSSNTASGLLVAICGPTPFTKVALGYLEELAYSPHDVFAFTA